VRRAAQAGVIIAPIVRLEPPGSGLLIRSHTKSWWRSLTLTRVKRPDLRGSQTGPLLLTNYCLPRQAPALGCAGDRRESLAPVTSEQIRQMSFWFPRARGGRGAVSLHSVGDPLPPLLGLVLADRREKRCHDGAAVNAAPQLWQRIGGSPKEKAPRRGPWFDRGLIVRTRRLSSLHG
jgi:hypothetical protein